MAGDDFSAEQKRYLEGFVSGVNAARSAANQRPFGRVPSRAGAAGAATGSDAAQLKAMARFEDAGQKLSAEEKAKREAHPFDIYARMKQAAGDGVYPKGVDVFRWKFHGLFYVAPAQDSFMCRLRIPNGILSHWQLADLADLARRHGGGCADVTTRANLQIREIDARSGIAVIEALQSLGLTSKGAGADNIRNVTGSPLAGIDPDELLDTRPLTREWHYHILNDRSLYGLPRKFNVSFDGGGRSAVLEETNDIGFQAVRVRAGFGVEPGVWCRLALGGITGHGDLARDTGVLVSPDETTRVADAVVRVFIDHGDRTDRRKARLKYLLDDWGFEKFLAEVETKLGSAFTRVSAQAIEPRARHDRWAHVGVHPQAQEGLHYVGIVLPVGRVTSAQMEGIACLAHEHGDGDIRLTVWQNLILSGVPTHRLDTVKSDVKALGLEWRASSVRAGLVACTGNAGCRFSASDTKGHAARISDHIDARLELDQPINIHLTGCHHSCAQHYIGDIGLLGARVAAGAEDGETIEGYHIFVGGGFGADAKIGREIWRDVPADQCPTRIEGLLAAYLAHRAKPEEQFHAFANRHTIDELIALVNEAVA